jgi:hypothetical protein
MTDRIVKAKIIPWEEDSVGIALEYQSGKNVAYPVKDRETAIKQLKLLKVPSTK